MRVARRTAHPAAAASPQSAGTATVALVKEEEHPLTATTEQEAMYAIWRRVSEGEIDTPI